MPKPIIRFPPLLLLTGTAALFVSFNTPKKVQITKLTPTPIVRNSNPPQLSGDRHLRVKSPEEVGEFLSKDFGKAYKLTAKGKLGEALQKTWTGKIVALSIPVIDYLVIYPLFVLWKKK